MNQKNLSEIDWSQIPAPEDDGSADHLQHAVLPNVALMSTRGDEINLGELSGRSVLFFYPMTGRPDVALPENWDEIPGARGCTPQSCGFRDVFSELQDHSVANVFGISTQSCDYQQEAAHRLQLPFALLSDDQLELSEAMRLPTMIADGKTLIRRLTLVVENSVVKQVFFPVFPPDKNAQDVLNFLKSGAV